MKNGMEVVLHSLTASASSPNKLGSFVSRFCCCWDPDLSSESPEVPAAWVPKGPERKIVCPTPGQITSCPRYITKNTILPFLSPSILEVITRSDRSSLDDHMITLHNLWPYCSQCWIHQLLV